jgi:hypothetical protein
MAEFYTANVNGGVFREINLDQVNYIDHGPSMDDIVTLHFGPGDEIGLAGSEARRFVDFWDNRWRKAAAKAA